MSESTSPGCLQIVATPIGNLEDLSPRAARVLSEVALIAAEDSRHSRRLLDAHGIGTPVTSLHEHNEAARCADLVSRMQAGEDIALISDAGTPLICDPGYRLVRAAQTAGLRVSPLPGPCAAIAALSVSGMATDRFLFAGFAPHKAGPRERWLQELVDMGCTTVIYESPHRIGPTVTALAELAAARELCIARELTKLHEQVWSGLAADAPAWLNSDSNHARGEFVLVLGALTTNDVGEAANLDTDKLLRSLLAEVPTKKAAKITAEATGLSRNALYQRALELQAK